MVAHSEKTAVIVTNSGEIAVAVAQRLATDGFAVVLGAARAQIDRNACVAAIRRGGGRAAMSEADLSDRESTRALFDDAEAAFAGVDVLVSDTDIQQLAPLADVDEASFQRHVAINIRGVLSGVRAAAQRLRAGGRIIDVPAATPSHLPPGDIHAATAAGLRALARILAEEMHAGRLALSAVVLCPRLPAATDAPSDLCDAVAFLALADAAAANGRVLGVERVTSTRDGQEH
jgi:3-oxoacyl-[acyl-carrier protein] reductase